MPALAIRDGFPEGFLTVRATDLVEILPEPTLLHLPGRRREPLFVSILLHGNEDVGLVAVQKLLRAAGAQTLPRALSIFVGNVDAAHLGVRRLEQQPDFNRVWPGAEDDGTPEHALMRQVMAEMRARRPFASIDLHNNTGTNPHYACVNRLDFPFLHLAAMFSRSVVYFQRPRGVQSLALSELCPAVTCECGKVGDSAGATHAAELLEACLRISEIPSHPPAEGDIHLFHTVATVKIPPGTTFGFASPTADLSLPADLESLNFRELPPGALFATRRPGTDGRLEIRDESNQDVSAKYLADDAGEIRLRRSVIPSMLTRNEAVIRQDCLCYFMERYPLAHV